MELISFEEGRGKLFAIRKVISVVVEKGGEIIFPAFGEREGKLKLGVLLGVEDGTSNIVGLCVGDKHLLESLIATSKEYSKEFAGHLRGVFEMSKIIEAEKRAQEYRKKLLDGFRERMKALESGIEDFANIKAVKVGESGTPTFIKTPGKIESFLNDEEYNFLAYLIEHRGVYSPQLGDFLVSPKELAFCGPFPQIEVPEPLLGKIAKAYGMTPSEFTRETKKLERKIREYALVSYFSSFMLPDKLEKAISFIQENLERAFSINTFDQYALEMKVEVSPLYDPNSIPTPGVYLSGELGKGKGLSAERDRGFEMEM